MASGPAFSFLSDPVLIYRESRRLIEEAVDFSTLPADLCPVVARMIHASGLPDIMGNLAFSGEDFVTESRKALAKGKPVLVDAQMVALGIQAHRFREDNAVLCFLGDPRIADYSRALSTTRSAAAIECWKPHIAGAIVVIGNAPTALFHLLSRLASGWPAPASIIGLPVGFVGASESKAALADLAPCPFITVRGRIGGSAMAAAALNAILPQKDAFSDDFPDKKDSPDDSRP